MVSLSVRLGRRVLREDVKEYLLDAILSGSFRPGDRIIETRVAQQLGVSQGPVREALRDLELFGFVVSEPFRGTRVRKTSTADLVEIYPIRAALEGVGARAAAAKIDAAGLDRLAQLLQEMRTAAGLDDRQAHIEADIAFHRTIIVASESRMLLQMWENTRLSSSTLVTVAVAHRSLLELADRHQPILAALQARDVSGAEAAMRQHIEELGGWVLAALEEHPDGAAALDVDGRRA